MTPPAGRVVVAVLASTFALGLLPAAAAAAAEGVTPSPSSFALDGMTPGETRSVDVDLTSTHATDGTVVRFTVTGSGALVGALSTSVEGCAVAWRGATCPSGATTLARDWRPTRTGDGGGLVVPADGVAHLRVAVSVDDDAGQGLSGTLRYGAVVQGEGPRPGGGGGGTGSSEGNGSGGGTGSGGGPLATTGAVVVPWAVAAGLALGAGAALVGRARTLRRREAR